PADRLPRAVARSARQRAVRQRFQTPVGGIPAPRRRRRTLAPRLPRRRPRRPARRGRLPFRPRRTPHRARGAPAVSREFHSRVIYSAAHVVADPLADNGPGRPATVDWDATIRYRRHLWDLGLGVADAMDTAQRGMGLD